MTPKARKPRNGPLAHGLAVQLALAMMSSGKARTKAQAAQMAGIDASNLKPSALRVFAENNPVGQKLTVSPHTPEFLTITADVDGKRVSARDALSSGVEASIRVVAKLGPKVGKLNKAQRAHLLDAKRFIDLARSSGMFAPPPSPSALPAELANQSPAEPTPEGALSSFLGDGESSTEDEGVSEACKVDDKP